MYIATKHNIAIIITCNEKSKLFNCSQTTSLDTATMEHKMVYLVTLCCALVHVSLAGFDVFFPRMVAKGGTIIYFSCKAVSYLLYPLLGWMADVCFTRYKFVLFSFIATILGSTLGIVTSALILEFPEYRLSLFYLAGLVIVIALIAIGLFESTAIQFGMDQMLEASSDKLSTFIHWYYWSSNLGYLVIMSISYAVVIYYHQCTVTLDIRKINNTALFLLEYETDIVNTAVLLCVGLQLVCACTGLCVLVCYKRQLNIDRTGEHPLKLIYQVLRYAWNHTCPENRSAFTYWEEDIPPRIDLGKLKYGGPFTTEEVEDTKTFFRIILLLLSLLGFHLSGHGYSLFDQLTRRQCPTVFSISLATDPMNTTLITITIGVPLYQLVFVHCCKNYVPNMLKRMGLGLLCCLIREVIKILIHVTMTKGKICKLADSIPIVSCYLISSKIKIINGTCSMLSEYQDYCDLNNTPFLLMIIPNVLQGLAFLLVFMSTLEFICAQAPLRLKGLLIGIWYALLTVYYLSVAVTELFITDVTTWEVFHEVKAFLIFLSLMLYLCVSRRYRYRLRDEVVNEQFLVEEIYERELSQAEEYKRERNRNYGSLNH